MQTQMSLAACILSSLVFFVPPATAAELLVGAATADIAPTGPVALWGQFYLRIAKTAETPLLANIVALQSRQDDQSLDAAVTVSCDLCAVPDEVLALVRESVAKRVPDLDPKKIFLSATHTHTAPILHPDGWHAIPRDGVMPVETYRAFLVERIAEAIEKAWKSGLPLQRPNARSWPCATCAIPGCSWRKIAVTNIMRGQVPTRDARPITSIENCSPATISTRLS
ncbi:MAG: hypothetical protein RBS80_24275 [Thermoguttaceae bacterium]|jgi:hypothetical protein|nr:hypothetical protein [Thermoguttaceae bacterium]